MVSHAWAALDVLVSSGNPHPARPGPADPVPRLRLRGELLGMVARALAAAAVPEVGVVRGGAAERLVFMFPPETPPLLVGVGFLDTLTRLLGARNGEHEAEDALRLALVVHCGPSDGAFAEIIRIADAPVLARVAAATPRAPVVLAVSEDWHAQAGAAPPGSVRVRGGGGTFWLHVPGTSMVPGLHPSDIPPSTRPAPGWSRTARPGGRTVHQTVHGSVHGDQVAGDKHVGGGHDLGPSADGGPAW